MNLIAFFQHWCYIKKNTIIAKSKTVAITSKNLITAGDGNYSKTPSTSYSGQFSDTSQFVS
jgi:hypothetical protein